MQGLGNPVTPTEMKIESYFMYPAAASIFRACWWGLPTSIKYYNIFLCFGHI